MYFSLPTSQERTQQQQQRQRQQQQRQEDNEKLEALRLSTVKEANHCSRMTTSSKQIKPARANSTENVTLSSNHSSPSNSNYLTDERLLEIVENLEDHWRSPPILTPSTLAMIFNNSYGDTSAPFAPLRSASSGDKNIISTASLQCFLSQLQKTMAQYIPALEKAIKEDSILGEVREGNTAVTMLGALDHLTQILAAFNQSDPCDTVMTSDEGQ